MRIAHLTDIHVADEKDYEGQEGWPTRVRKHSQELLGHLLTDLHAQRPDHVVLTGDLTQTALRGEFEKARRHLDRHLPGVKVSVLPGNHDRWNADSEAHFLEWFGDLARCDLGGKSGFPFCHVRENVALIGLDSSPFVPETDPADVKGYVAPAQLEKLKEIARDGRVAGRFLVALLHHHLRLSDEDAVADDPKDPTPLENAEEVQAALFDAGVHLVLHGHRHKQMRVDLSWQGRTIPVLCPGSATRVDHRPDRTGRYSLYSIENGVLGPVQTRVWEPDTQRFVWG